MNIEWLYIQFHMCYKGKQHPGILIVVLKDIIPQQLISTPPPFPPPFGGMLTQLFNSRLNQGLISYQEAPVLLPHVILVCSEPDIHTTTLSNL